MIPCISLVKPNFVRSLACSWLSVSKISFILPNSTFHRDVFLEVFQSQHWRNQRSSPTPHLILAFEIFCEFASSWPLLCLETSWDLPHLRQDISSSTSEIQPASTFEIISHAQWRPAIVLDFYCLIRNFWGREAWRGLSGGDSILSFSRIVTRKPQQSTESGGSIIHKDRHYSSLPRYQPSLHSFSVSSTAFFFKSFFVFLPTWSSPLSVS